MAARPKNSGLTPLLSLLSLCKTPKGDIIHTHIQTYIHTYKEQSCWTLGFPGWESMFII